MSGGATPRGPRAPRRPAPEDARACAEMLRALRRCLAPGRSAAEGAPTSCPAPRPPAPSATDPVSIAWRRLGEGPFAWWLALATAAGGTLLATGEHAGADVVPELLRDLAGPAAATLAAGCAVMAAVVLCLASRRPAGRRLRAAGPGARVWPRVARRTFRRLTTAGGIWALVIAGWALGMGLLGLLIVVARGR